MVRDALVVGDQDGVQEVDLVILSDALAVGDEDGVREPEGGALADTLGHGEPAAVMAHVLPVKLPPLGQL